MSQTESLNIKVTEEGASHVAEMFNKIATEANTAATAVAKMRKQVGGKGTVAEAKKGGTGKAVDEAKKAEKEIAAAYTATQKKRREEGTKSWKAEVANNQKIVSDHAKAQKKLRAEGDKTWKTEVANNKRVSASAVAEQQRVRAAREKTLKEGRTQHMARAKAGNAANKKIVSDHARAQKRIRAEGAKTWKMEVAGNARSAKAHDKAAAAARRHKVSMESLGKTVAKNSHGMRALGNQVFFAQRAFAALGGVLVIRQYLAMTDAFQNMNNRLKLVTTSANHLGDTQKRLFKIAKNTRQSVKDTVETYVRLNLSLKNAGISQERLMGVMSTLNKMLAVSGASAIEASQSIRQLSQAFSKGKLDGDEFRSVSEAMPSILTALETSLGKTRGELRDMSEQGLITGEVLLEAFEAVKTSVDQDFESSIVTLGQAWQVLKDEVLKAVGAFNTSSGVGGLLVKSVMLLANNLWLVIAALKVLFLWVMFKMTAALIAATLNTIVWATTLNSTLIPAMLNTVRMLGFGIAKFGILKTAALGGAKAMGFFGAAVAAVIFVGWKLYKWMDEMGPKVNKFKAAVEKNLKVLDVLRQKLAHMRLVDPTDERIEKLEKEIRTIEKRDKALVKDVVAAEGIEKENKLLKNNNAQIDETKHNLELLKTGISELSVNLSGQKGVIKDLRPQRDINKDIEDQTELLALQKEEREVLRGPGRKGLAEAKEIGEIQKLENSHTELRKALGFTKKGQEEYAKSVKDTRRLNDLGKISYEEMIETLGRLKFAFENVRGTDAVTELFTAQQIRLNNLASATKEFASLQSGGKNKEGAASGAEQHLSLLEKRASIVTGLIDKRKNLDAAVLEGIEAQADGLIAREKKILAAEAAFAKLTGKEKKGGKKPKVDDSLAAFVASMNPVFSASRRLEKATTMLNDAWEKGIPITAEVNAAYEELQKRTKAARLPTEHLMGLMSDMIATQHLSTKELEKLNAETAERDRLLATGATEAAVEAYMRLTKVINEQRKAREANGRAALLETPPSFAEGHESRRFYEEEAKLVMATSVGDRTRLQINNELLATRRELNTALIEGHIELSDHNILTQNATEQARLATAATQLWGGALQGVIAQLTDVAIEDLWISTVTNAFLAMEEIMIEGIIHVEGALFDLATGATTDWDDFTTAMKDMFHDAAEAMLKDITRILIRLAAVRLIEGALGGGGGLKLGDNLMKPGFRHGGTVDTTKLPRFANGGAMQVGGQGGPDTKLVQFMASPGENVHVTNPGQSRLDNKQAAPAAAPVVNVNTFFDPNEVPSAMASPSGERVVLNIIQQNSALLARMLK